ncbi:MAG: ribonuclease III, partial [Bacteroidetes bacterium]
MLDFVRRRIRHLFRRSPAPASDLRERIEALVGTAVGDLAVYEQALTHRSVLRGRPDSHLRSNERLEFLGDAVLGFVVAEHLYRHFPEK